MREAEESTALIVPVECAQKIRYKLEKLNLWNATYKLKKFENSDHVAIPIDISRGNITAINDIWPDFKIDKLHLPISKKIKVKQNSHTAVLQREIKQLLNNHGISEELLDELPSKWEKHHDLIIIPAHAFSSPEWSLLGSNLWHVIVKCLACKRLARHSAIADNGFRSSKVTMLLGQNGEVTHVDNGIKYAYDVTKCMFSAGNITEKIRVASLDCTNETVVDLYAGIGYFTLPYLIHAKAHHVHACEWNPDAAAALKQNLVINGVSDRCTVHEGDNRLLQLPPLADRVNLGLIPSSEDGWPVAVQVLKECGGILHVHGNVTTMHQKIETDGQACDVHQGKDQKNETDGQACGVHQGKDQKIIPSAKNDVGHVYILCQQKEMKNNSAENSGQINSYQEKGVRNIFIAQKNAENLPEPDQMGVNNISRAVQGSDDDVKDCSYNDCMNPRPIIETKENMSGLSCGLFVENDEIVSSGLQDIGLSHFQETTSAGKSKCIFDDGWVKEADQCLQQSDSNLQLLDASLGHAEYILRQTDQKLKHALSNLHEADPESVNNISKQQVFIHTMEGDRKKHIPLNSEVTDVMTSEGISLKNLSPATDDARENDFDVTCQKRLGKRNILLACQQWSFYVQGKIKSLLEAKKGGVWTVKELHIEVVKSYAPHIVHAVLDIECRPILCVGDLNDNCMQENM